MTDAISRYLERQRDRQLAFLAALVRAPSDNPPGDCAPHAHVARTLLEGLGLPVAAYPVPEARARRAGMISATNLIVRHRFGDGSTLALNAHGDVVPPGLGWTHDPYGAEIAGVGGDARMYGRGVAVSKSDFATYAFALLALREAAAGGARLGGTVELHFTWDEETGGQIGPKFLLDEGLARPDYAICAGFSHAIVNAHNGCLHLEVTVTGCQAHAAEPAAGRDALEATTGVLAALYAHRAKLAERCSAIPGIAAPTLNVGTISGGIAANVVPDRVRFRLDRRIVPEETPSDAEAELRALVAEAASEYPDITVETAIVLAAAPLAPGPGWERLAEALARHAAPLLGHPVPVVGSPLYTDARHYAAAGIPVVLYGAGPRTLAEANGHNADENLRLADLAAATEIVARALVDLLGGS